MKNLKLQQLFSQPLVSSAFDGNENCFIASRDGKSLIAITYKTINNPKYNGSKSVHVCKFEIDSINSPCKKDPEATCLLDILQDVDSEEIQTLLDTPAIGVVHGSEDEESDNFEDMLDLNCVQNIVVGMKSGHLIKIRLATQDENDGIQSSEKEIQYQASILGSFDDGIAAMCRSPDEELVVAVSGGIQGNGQQVIVMSSEFDLLLETPLDPDAEGVEESVNVGWGAKETQFHGKAGKQAAKAKTNLEVSGYLDDKQVKIVWREDCQFFAISHLSKHLQNEVNSPLRRIRIFDREGTLLHTSELIGGLESGKTFTWKPSGSLMAGTVRKPNGKYVVAFFEKNGLMHGDFELKVPSKSLASKIAATHLEWNKDSTVLMVICNDVFSEEDEKSKETETQYYIQLWTVSNYRWHLKQCMTFKSPIVFHEWASVLPDGTQHPLVLNIVTADGSFRSYRYSLRVDCSGESLIDTSDSCERDLANVAIIDGCTLKVTPFSQTVVPPPISAYELHFRNEVRQVVFPTASNHHRNKMLVITTNDEVFLCKVHNLSSSNDNEDSSKSVVVTGCGGQGFGLKCDIMKPDAVSNRLIYNSKMSSALVTQCEDLSNFCYLKCQANEHNSWIVASKDNNFFVFELLEQSNDYCVKTIHKCESPIFNITSIVKYGRLNDYEKEEAVIQLSNGMVLSYQPENDTLVPWLAGDKELRIVAKCPKLTAIQLQSQDIIDSDCSPIKLLSLSEKNRLYLDGIEIATGITSYFVHTHFLLITTLQHTLRSLPISVFFKTEITNEVKNELWINESTRALERGSRLVVAVPPPDTKVVLQMPRGNLEVIHPRVLALQIVKGLLDNCKFSAAMEIFRRQRINQNLIVDHNPSHFTNNVQNFVAQVSNEGTQRLCLFVADLMEEDCTTTMFKSMYCETVKTTEAQNSITNITSLALNETRQGKIWDVCSSLLTVLETDVERYILPIISCLVKRTSSTTKSIMDKHADGIEDALLRVQRMRSINSKLAEEALSFLSLLVVGEGGGGDRLFDSALGVYDFDLVLFVAEKSSQKDPKEYLPFLNELRMLPQGETYRNYRIDMYLKRHRVALKHIAKYVTNNITNTNGEELSTEENELLQLVKEQRLYSEALKIFQQSSSSPDHVRRIHSRLAVAYADYLYSKKYYEDSALMYESGYDNINAMKAWEQAGNWSYCLALASKEKLSTSEFEALCRRLVEKLKGN